LEEFGTTRLKWMLDVLEFHSVKQRVNFGTLILVFKIKNNMVPEYMNAEITYKRDAMLMISEEISWLIFGSTAHWDS
jgi:hypothetical protein